MKKVRTGVLVLAVSAGVLSACAINPELQIYSAPLNAVTERQYGVVAKDHPEVTDLVRKSLEAKGGIAAEQGWRVMATMAVRPVGVGAFSDTPARAGQWSESPRISGARRGAMLHVLSVVLESADGSEQRFVQVSGRNDKTDTPQALLEQLSEAAAVAAYEGLEPAGLPKQP